LFDNLVLDLRHNMEERFCTSISLQLVLGVFRVIYAMLLLKYLKVIKSLPNVDIIS